MENADRELLMRVVETDPDLKRLYFEHVKLEKQVERLSYYARYSSSASLRRQELKKQKLRGMDNIMSILKEHRVG